MEKNDESKKINNVLLSKKRKKSNLIQKDNKSPNSEEINKDSILFETSTELSYENVINLEEKPEIIPGLDDINIPSFLNDNNEYNDINKKIKNYYKAKKALGSNELAELYLINVHRLYEEKKKIKKINSFY